MPSKAAQKRYTKYAFGVFSALADILLKRVGNLKRGQQAIKDKYRQKNKKRDAKQSEIKEYISRPEVKEQIARLQESELSFEEAARALDESEMHRVLFRDVFTDRAFDAPRRSSEPEPNFLPADLQDELPSERDPETGEKLAEPRRSQAGALQAPPRPRRDVPPLIAPPQPELEPPRPRRDVPPLTAPPRSRRDVPPLIAPPEDPPEFPPREAKESESKLREVPPLITEESLIRDTEELNNSTSEMIKASKTLDLFLKPPKDKKRKPAARLTDDEKELLQKMVSVATDRMDSKARIAPGFFGGIPLTEQPINAALLYIAQTLNKIGWLEGDAKEIIPKVDATSKEIADLFMKIAGKPPKVLVNNRKQKLKKFFEEVERADLTEEQKSLLLSDIKPQVNSIMKVFNKEVASDPDTFLKIVQPKLDRGVSGRQMQRAWRNFVKATILHDRWASMSKMRLANKATKRLTEAGNWVYDKIKNKIIKKVVAPLLVAEGAYLGALYASGKEQQKSDEKQETPETPETPSDTPQPTSKPRLALPEPRQPQTPAVNLPRSQPVMTPRQEMEAKAPRPRILPPRRYGPRRSRGLPALPAPRDVPPESAIGKTGTASFFEELGETIAAGTVGAAAAAATAALGPAGLVGAAASMAAGGLASMGTSELIDEAKEYFFSQGGSGSQPPVDSRPPTRGMIRAPPQETSEQPPPPPQQTSEQPPPLPPPQGTSQQQRPIRGFSGNSMPTLPRTGRRAAPPIVEETIVPPTTGETSPEPPNVEETTATEQGPVTMQQKLQGVQRGTLRPEFIIPSAEIFEPTPSQQRQSEIDFAKFDFVKPYSIGGLNDDQTNPLSKKNELEEYIRFLGWQQITTMAEQKAKQYMERKARMRASIPRTGFPEDREKAPYRVNPLAQFESPYRFFSDANELSNREINDSILYGVNP